VTTETPIPTLSDKIAEWLGFQLPSIPMPQSMKNLDKAVGKILLAVGENAEARIRANTSKSKAKGKIEIDGLYRTEEEKRKIENRAAIVKVAVDDISGRNSDGGAEDAKREIDDDWLNLFARLAEDKSSEELKGLFGRILAGEIRSPGAFSLRTIQFLSTLSKDDAYEISKFLSFALSSQIVPFLPDTEPGPDVGLRIMMQELGLASQANSIGGLSWNAEVPPNDKLFLTGTATGVLLANQSSRPINLRIACQALTKPAQELTKIANPPPSNIGYMKAVAQSIFDQVRANHADDLSNDLITVSVVAFVPFESNQFRFQQIHKTSVPG
jgi:hypothetical protein